jgi:hypothetical protein
MKIDGDLMEEDIIIIEKFMSYMNDHGVISVHERTAKDIKELTVVEDVMPGVRVEWSREYTMGIPWHPRDSIRFIHTDHNISWTAHFHTGVNNETVFVRFAGRSFVPVMDDIAFLKLKFSDYDHQNWLCPRG